jgi:glutathione synthase
LAALDNAIASGADWVLKPQREGGGNNMYGSLLSEFLVKNRNLPILKSYVLMRRILPVIHKSAFLRSAKMQVLPSIHEYGAYGIYLGDGSNSPLINDYAGYLVRTKPFGNSLLFILQKYFQV